MLTALTKRYLPAVVRAQITSPCVYPALSHAVEIMTASHGSNEFSTLTTTKKIRPTLKFIHAPRPKPELQNWNLPGTTTLASNETQMQSWNHHDPIPELAGGSLKESQTLKGVLKDRFYYPQNASDLPTKAMEMELLNEEAQNEICTSTGRVVVQASSAPRPQNSQLYYPQYASDLADKAYEMDHMENQAERNKNAAAAKEGHVAAVPNKTYMYPTNPSSRPGMKLMPLSYPQGASDLATKAYEMDHFEEKKTGSRMVKKASNQTPFSKVEATHNQHPTNTPFFYPQYASDLMPKAFEMEHPDEGMSATPNLQVCKDISRSSASANTPYYPQNASDLVDEAYGMDHPDMKTKVPQTTNNPSRVAGNKTPYYPQNASDLLDKAYEMDHPEMKTKVPSPTNDPSSPMAETEEPYYPQIASDLLDEAYEMDHPEMKAEVPPLTNENPSCMAKTEEPYYPQIASDLLDEAYEMDHPAADVKEARPQH